MKALKNILKKGLAVMAFMAILTVPSVYAATSTLQSTVTGQTLDVTTGASTVTLSAVNVTTAAQNLSGNLTSNTVTDTRGTGAGWTASGTLRNGGGVAQVVQASGTANANLTVDTTNTSYAPPSTQNHGTGSHCVYTITIGTTGVVGTATYTAAINSSANAGCTADSTTSTTSAASNNSVGSAGVKVGFGSGTFTATATYVIVVDEVYASKWKVTASNRSASSGSTTNVSLGNSGSAQDFSGTGTTSDSLTVLSATAGYGMGAYLYDLAFAQGTSDNNMSANPVATPTSEPYSWLYTGTAA